MLSSVCDATFERGGPATQDPHTPFARSRGLIPYQEAKGKPVALPPRGNTSLSEGWDVLMRVNGMKLDDLGTKSYGSLTENAEAIRNRQAVAMGWCTTVPASFMLDLGTSMKLRMLSLSDADIKKFQEFNAGFVKHVIPKSTYAQYGIEDDVVTPGAEKYYKEAGLLK